MLVGKWRYNDIVVAVPKWMVDNMSISGPMRLAVSGGFNMNGTIPPTDGHFTFDGSNYFDGVPDAYSQRL